MSDRGVQTMMQTSDSSSDSQVPDETEIDNGKPSLDVSFP